MADWLDAAGQEDRPKPPPELGLWFKIRDWGDPWGQGWMKWPAGELDRLRLARNVFNAWSSYLGAKNRAEWGKDPKNASANGIVGNVKALRFERGEELSAVERWGEWEELRVTSDELRGEALSLALSHGERGKEKRDGRSSG